MPEDILQILAETALDPYRAHSAGFSLRDEHHTISRCPTIPSCL